MKKYSFILFVCLLSQTTTVRGQNADPYISILMTPVLLSLNGVGTLYINAGNVGNSTIAINSLRIELNTGINAEIIGIQSNPDNDMRWTLDTLTTGVSNRAILHNSAGDFGSFDIGELFISIVGRDPSEPILITGSITYITGNNPTLGGLPNSSQGNATTLNDYSQSTVSVSYSIEDCANGIDDDVDGFIDCEDGDCSLTGIDGSYALSVTPLFSSFCTGDSIILNSSISNLPATHPTIWYQWFASDTTSAFSHDTMVTIKDSGIYDLVILNITGCSLRVDSIVVEATSIDASVSLVDTVLTALMPNATYQWIACDNDDLPIVGATDQIFTATQNGSYAVIVSKNGCIDTSACYSVVNVGLDRFKNKNNTRLYPNPFSDELYLEFEKILENTTVTIFSLDGKIIFKQYLSEKKTLLPTEDLPKGIYFVKIQNNEDSFFYNMVKA